MCMVEDKRMRLTEEEYAQLMLRMKGRPLQAPSSPIEASEAAFQAAVIRLAKEAGYLVYFTKDSRRSPSGFPDLALAKAGAPLILTELKTETGQVTPAQAAWIEALGQASSIEAHVWRPSEWSTIETRLRASLNKARHN